MTVATADSYGPPENPVIRCWIGTVRDRRRVAGTGPSRRGADADSSRSGCRSLLPPRTSEGDPSERRQPATTSGSGHPERRRTPGDRPAVEHSAGPTTLIHSSAGWSAPGSGGQGTGKARTAPDRAGCAPQDRHFAGRKRNRRRRSGLFRPTSAFLHDRPERTRVGVRTPVIFLSRACRGPAAADGRLGRWPTPKPGGTAPAI